MKFVPFQPPPLPGFDGDVGKWAERLVAILEESHNALSQTLNGVGQDLTAFNSKFILMTASEALSSGDVCYLDSAGGMTLANAWSADSCKSLLGVATSDLSLGEVGSFQVRGVYTTSGLSTGDVLYVDTTPGGLTNTQPVRVGQVVRVIGYALSNTSLWLDPDKTWVEVE